MAGPCHTEAMPAPVAPQPSPDLCPRCGGPFHCGARDPGPCACAGLALTPELLGALRTRWSRCLCLSCLQALSTGATLDPDPPPTPTASA